MTTLLPHLSFSFRRFRQAVAWRPAKMASLPGLGSLVFLALAGSGCGGGGLPNAEEGAAQGILLQGIGTEPATLDPHKATGVTENRVISALLEGLINYHPTDDSLPFPGVAERWEPNEDFSEWTFHLRETARWSNGDPVTASDFAYAFERILTPALGAKYAQMLYVLAGAEAFHQGQSSDFGTVGVEVLDAQTLRLRLKGPIPYFPNLLKHYSWFPVHPPTIEAQPAGMTDLSGSWTRDAYVGNGPFVMDTWQPQQFIYATASETYWDAEAVGLEGIYFLPINDQETEMRMFQSGQLHVTSSVPTNYAPVLREREDPAFRSDPYLGVYYYRFNVTRPPLDDPRVRRALALTIDREEVTRDVTQGGQQPATTFVPPGFDGYSSPPGAAYDAAEARRLLAAAGFPEGEGFPRLKLLFNTSEAHRKVAESIVRNWNRELGIDLQLENQEWGTYLDTLNQLDYDIARSAWIGDYLDPVTFLEIMRTGNGNNRTGWSDPAFDQRIRIALTPETSEAHYAALYEAEEILLQAMPLAPIYFYVNNYMLHPAVQNWHPKLLDNRPIKQVRLSAERAAERESE